MTNNALPYWRLSSFYFFYFASLGIFLPYWSPYLKSTGFDAVAIGQLSALLAATKVVAPVVWGWIADHRGHRMQIIRIASLCACLAFSGILLTNNFFWMAMVISLFGFFWNAALPQFEATTFTHLGDSTQAYTAIRIWGSIGFIASVWLLGGYFESYSIELLPVAVLLLLAGIFISSLIVPETAAGHRHLSGESLIAVLKQPKVIALLTVCFLMQFGHAPYYTFYSIYLEEYGYSKLFIGGMWAISVIAEVVVFIFMPRLIAWLGLRSLLLASLALAGLRWLIIAHAVHSVLLLLTAQLLHAATFGIYHAVAIQLIHRYFHGRLQGRGQALYSSISFGAGISIGSLLVGYSWANLGSAISFHGAAAVSLLGFFIAWRWIGEQSFS